MTDVDGGVMPRGAQFPRQNQMSIQNAADRIANRLVEIVTFHQHGEEAGDGAFFEMAGPFEYLWQHCENGWRVPLLTGRLARSEADLALCHGQARNGIHHEQNILALIAEILGYRQRYVAGSNTERRRTIRGRYYNHRPAAPFRAEFVFKKRPDFTIAFSNQSDDTHVRIVVPRHRAEQRALTNAAPAKDADALPFAARKHPVDGANAG